MKPKKELGQNFLVDQRVINDVIITAQISKEDVVLEVGAGTGALTRPLAEKAGKVIAVEIDKDLIPKLQTNLKGLPTKSSLASGGENVQSLLRSNSHSLAPLENVEIINEDVLKLPIDNYQLTNYKVVGSIPYQITSPLIHKLLKETPRPKSITIVVQKEVGEKTAAKPPEATYLSNFVANFGQAKIFRVIKPNAFRPQPKVDSALLHISLYPSARGGSAFGGKPHIQDIGRFERFLHHGFAQPRKMLNKRFPAETLQRLGIDPKRRPQTLSFEEWVKLFKAVKE